MKKLIITASAILLLQGCTTFDPYTGESKTTKTAIGAATGASLAAVVAYIANKDEDGIQDVFLSNNLITFSYCGIIVISL